MDSLEWYLTRILRYQVWQALITRHKIGIIKTLENFKFILLFYLIIFIFKLSYLLMKFNESIMWSLLITRKYLIGFSKILEKFFIWNLMFLYENSVDDSWVIINVFYMLFFINKSFMFFKSVTIIKSFEIVI